MSVLPSTSDAMRRPRIGIGEAEYATECSKNHARSYAGKP